MVWSDSYSRIMYQTLIVLDYVLLVMGVWRAVQTTKQLKSGTDHLLISMNKAEKHFVN